MPRALLSVSDKSGLVEFASALVNLGFEIVATGGTKRALAEAGIPVTAVADVTGAPEILGGRVKTLHPAIHGALLALPTPEHDAELARHDLTRIDLVAVNLYPFRETVAREGVTDAEDKSQVIPFMPQRKPPFALTGKWWFFSFCRNGNPTFRTAKKER